MIFNSVSSWSWSCLVLYYKVSSGIWFHKISYDKVEKVLNRVEYSVQILFIKCWDNYLRLGYFKSYMIYKLYPLTLSRFYTATILISVLVSNWRLSCTKSCSHFLLWDQGAINLGLCLFSLVYKTHIWHSAFNGDSWDFY